MKLIIATIVAALALVALGANPSPPSFPSGFQLVFNVTQGGNVVATYTQYYDFQQQKERFDVLASNLFGFLVILNRWDQNPATQYNVTREIGGNNLCREAKMTNKMTPPTFLAGATFIGQATVNGELCNQFKDPATGNTWAFAVSDNSPVQETIANSPGTAVVFGTLTPGPQPASFFNLPKGTQCF